MPYDAGSAPNPIVAKTQGHRSNVNAPYLDGFVAWLRALDHEPGTVVGEPIYRRFRGARRLRDAAGGEPRWAEANAKEPGKACS
jgi:hypothetical protein